MDIILVPKFFLMSIHFFVSGIAIVIRSCLILLFLNCFSLLLSMNLFLLPSISFLFNNKVFLFAAIFYIYIIKDLPLKIILLTTTVQQSNVELKYILTKILQELQILRIESNSKITKLKNINQALYLGKTIYKLKHCCWYFLVFLYHVLIIKYTSISVLGFKLP